LLRIFAIWRGMYSASDPEGQRTTSTPAGRS